MATIHTVLIAITGALTALVLIGAGTSKIAGKPAMRESAEHFSIPWNRYRLIGVVEIVLAIGVVLGIWVNPVGLTAGIAVVTLMLGAVGFHLRFGDPITATAPSIITTVVSAVYVVAQGSAI